MLSVAADMSSLFRTDKHVSAIWLHSYGYFELWTCNMQLRSIRGECGSCITIPVHVNASSHSHFMISIFADHENSVIQTKHSFLIPTPDLNKLLASRKGILLEQQIKLYV